MQRLTQLGSLSVLALLAVALPAPAYTVYTNATNYANALSGNPGGGFANEEFDAVITDQSFRAADGSKTIGAFTFAETGSSTAGTGDGSPNQIDAAPFQFGGDYSDLSNPYVLLSVNTNYGVNLTFPSAVRAFRGNFTQVPGATVDTFRITLLNANLPTSFALPATGFTFWGVIAGPGESFTGLSFSTELDRSGRGLAGLDEVSIQFVPEPATAFLVGFAALGLVARRPARRAAKH